MARRILYHESFDEGAGRGWTRVENRATPDGEDTGHQNAHGHYGAGVPLEWSPRGGRSGGYAPSASPWYWDDNHG